VTTFLSGFPSIGFAALRNGGSQYPIWNVARTRPEGVTDDERAERRGPARMRTGRARASAALKRDRCPLWVATGKAQRERKRPAFGCTPTREF
jgi:hypothetical protein